MKLREYMNLEGVRPTRLALVLGVAPAYLYQMATGVRSIAPDRAIEIEKATAGAVRCEELRPDVDWAYLRGSSKAADLANTQPATPAPADSDIATAAAGQGA